jgi:hypothetical protein
VSGAIRDLGYKRYAGGRRPQSTRWQVIVRNQVSQAWKTWWRFKMALGWAIVVGLVVGAMMYIGRALPLPQGGKWGILGNVLDGLPPLAVPWLCRAAFLVGLTVAAGTIAGDAQVGAFTFYFARPVRPIDYVAGKMLGVFLLMFIIIGAPLIALTLFRCGLADDSAELMRCLPMVGKAVIVGVLGAAVFAAVPVGLSAIVARRRNAIALWATYYLVVGGMLYGIGLAASPAVKAFDLLIAVQSVARHLFDVQFMPGMFDAAPLGWSLASIGLHIAASVAIAVSLVSERAHVGVGGS